MFKWLTSLMAGVVMAVVAPAAHAGFISTDVLVSGDSRAFVHQETGVEWLRLSNTDGMSISQALTAFPGWRLPTEDEVIAMSKDVFKFASPTKYQTLPVADDGRTRYFQNGYTSCASTSPFCAIANYFGGGLFGWTDEEQNKDGVKYSMGGIYLDEDNNVAAVNAKRWYNNYYKEIDVNLVISADQNWSNSTYGVFLVSDGGLTLSSKLDPSLNANNINAPVNNPVPEPTPEPTVPVNAPMLGALGLLLVMLCSSRTGRKAIFQPS